MDSVVCAVDVSVDQIIKRSVSVNFHNIQDADVPFSKDQQLIKLLGEVLHANFNSDVSGEVNNQFVVQFLEVLTLAEAV